MAKKRSELKPSDEVVVTLGAKQDSQNGKTVTVEKKRDVVMTLAGFESIQVDKDGHSPTLGRTVELKGTPVYNEESESLAGLHKELDKAEPFAKEKEAAPAPPAA